MAETLLALWETQRVFIKDFTKAHLVEGVDFYSLKIGNRETKPSLSKAGAEKFLGLFQLRASFQPDTGSWEMFGQAAGLVCLLCTLTDKDGTQVAEGRSARHLTKDGNDHNKTVKMVEKAAMIDAVIRYGALSDIFTQDIEDMQETPPVEGRTTPPAKSAPQTAQNAPGATKTQEGTPGTFTATELIPDHYNGKLSWKLRGEDIPRSNKTYGMLVGEDVLVAAGLPIHTFSQEETTAIGRYKATYSMKPSKNPNFKFDPDRVIALVAADDDDDVPF